MARTIMIQGTMSNAGKSLLAAGLCRIFRQDGLRAAPFKSQNMALNSFITAAGGEMGRAQVVQAQAAGIAPDVRMNPILLKPTTDMGSQVIVNGAVVGNMTALEYYRRKNEFIPAVLEAYHSLAAEYDVIVIEGAGSPAEINLKREDIVNMGLARLVDAPVLLVGDIDRGGVFAQLYGTIALLDGEERRRVKGTIVNKFRGDRAILQPGLEQLERYSRLRRCRYGGQNENALPPQSVTDLPGGPARRVCRAAADAMICSAHSMSMRYRDMLFLRSTCADRIKIK